MRNVHKENTLLECQQGIKYQIVCKSSATHKCSLCDVSHQCHMECVRLANNRFTGSIYSWMTKQYIFDLEKIKEKIAEIVPRVFILGIMVQKLIFWRKKSWNFILFSVQILCIASTVLFLFRIWDGDRYLVNLRYSMRMKYNTLCTAYSCTHWTTEQVLVVLASRMSTLNTFPE